MKEYKVFNKVLKVITIVAIIAAVFFAGFFTRYFTIDSDIRTLAWMKDKIDRYYYEDITGDEFTDSALNGINGMLDKYSQCYTPDEYISVSNNNAGIREGLGMSFYIGYGNIMIYRVRGNSPAERSGFKEGYYITAFGKGDNLTYSNVYSEFTDFLSTLSDGEEMNLVMSEDDKGSNSKILSVRSERFTENYVFYRSSSTAYRFTGENATDESGYDGAIPSLDGDTAYIRINQFNGNAFAQMRKSMEIFKREGKKHLILDLRYNGGGKMSILQGISSYLLKDAKGNSPIIAVAKYKNGRKENFRADSNIYYDYFSADSNITVLANSNTASASECLIGAMIDYGTVDYSDIYLVEYNGEMKTYGKGIMQTTYYNVDGGSAIKLTTATVHWPVSDRCIHGVGVTGGDGANCIPSDVAVSFDERELLGIIASLKE